MTTAPVYADAEGAVLAWAGTVPSLTGAGNPIAAGLHLSPDVRSPAEGAIGYVEVVDRSADDVADTPRVTAVFLSRRRGPAEIAARAWANAIDKIVAVRPVVTTARGDAVKIFGVGDVAGPTFAGDFGGEVAYRVDATFVIQPR